MLQIWYNGSDHVIAETKEQAIAEWEKTTGDNWSQYELDGEDWEVDNRESWTINFEDEDDCKKYSPSNAEFGKHPNGNYYAKATQEQWIEFDGVGWFCSENW